MAPAFGKRKTFIAKFTCKEIGGKTLICLPNPEFQMSFKGPEGIGCHVEVLVGQVLIGQLWILAIYRKGFSTQSSSTMYTALLKVFWCAVLVMFRSFGSGWRGRFKTLVPGAAGSQNSLLSTHFSCMTCDFGLLSLKNFWCLVRNRIEPFWAGSAIILSRSFGHIHQIKINRKCRGGKIFPSTLQVSVPRPCNQTD